MLKYTSDLLLLVLAVLSLFPWAVLLYELEVNDERTGRKQGSNKRDRPSRLREDSRERFLTHSL
jgi:hypothetical protein